VARPKLLDLFCCEGGAGTGYHRAGFDVVGVDITTQPRYPFDFVQFDAIAYVLAYGDQFDAIHASPPCQRYSTMTADPEAHPDLIGLTRTALQQIGKPYVIENVAGAASELDHPVMLCGSGFGLGVRRHRLFESNVPLWGMPCVHGTDVPVGVYGNRKEGSTIPRRPDGTSRGARAQSERQASEALGGVEWMSWHGMRECIPPIYAQHIGEQLMEAL
jgi:DNA (cytosine-5)-methyltransferase 1